MGYSWTQLCTYDITPVNTGGLLPFTSYSSSTNAKHGNVVDVSPPATITVYLWQVKKHRDGRKCSTPSIKIHTTRSLTGILLSRPHQEFKRIFSLVDLTSLYARLTDIADEGAGTNVRRDLHAKLLALVPLADLRDLELRESGSIRPCGRWGS